MKLILLTFAGLLLLSDLLFAQNARFTTSGIIEYQKTANMYALIKKQINKDNESYIQPMFDQYKKNQPQFRVLKSTLSFAQDKTLYTPVAETGTIPGGWLGDNPLVSQNNVIFTDLASSSSTCKKTVFEETFLVKDTTRKINWKITNETREIAGYTCRRANALILDSIYVVAFYTDEIPVSGGPESFTGLPGMILGVALPHENITWFATKITDTSVPANILTPPTKGKAISNKELRTTMQSVSKDWGSFAQLALKGVFL